MLVSLRVRDLAVLEDVDVALETGLTVLTGETGAGKSLVVDALSLLSGESGDATLVRAGADRLVVEGSFETDDAGVLETLDGRGARGGRRAAGRDRGRRDGGRCPPRGRGVSSSTARPRRCGPSPTSPPASSSSTGRPRRASSSTRRRRGSSSTASPASPTAAAGGRPAPRDLAGARGGDRDGSPARGKDEPERLELLEFRLGEIDGVSPAAGEEEELAAQKLALSNVEKRGRLLSQAVAALESDEGGALPALQAAPADAPGARARSTPAPRSASRRSRS